MLLRSFPKRVGLFLVASQLSVSAVNVSSVSSTAAAAMATNVVVDREYPGTALTRLSNIHSRVRELNEEKRFSGDWTHVRRMILFAGGLKDLPDHRPGAGYTGHSFNDWNHCDLTPMLLETADNENGGRVEGIAMRNHLGDGIRAASLPDLGPGGSWSTCLMGCASDPPEDVAHVQFRSRIAFKLVWAPPSFETFVLVDDEGTLLAVGEPTGGLPPLSQRQRNYASVKGSKYGSAAADAGAGGAAAADEPPPSISNPLRGTRPRRM